MENPHLGTAEWGVLDEALPFAEEVADDLRPWLLDRFGRQQAEVKDDGTLVTDADVEADERIASAIRERFPEHEVVSEELGTTFHGGTWCWVVDPIDGTTNFVRGNPNWTVSMGLAYEGQPVLGLMDAPALATRYRAVASRGAVSGTSNFAEEDRLAVSDVDWNERGQVENALVGLSSPVGRSHVLDLPPKPRVLGCESLHLASVAGGALVASIHAGVHVWDVAAGILLVLEAGGVVVEVSGEAPFPLRPGEDQAGRELWFVAAASEQSAQRIIAALRQP